MAKFARFASRTTENRFSCTRIFMSVHWYFSHDGTTHGPFSEKEIYDLVARYVVLENDLVWPEGREQKDAAPAKEIFDFAQGPAPISPIPDWLADVTAAENKGPVPDPLPTHEIPEWLEDLRLWIGLELYTPAKHPANEHAGSAQSGTLPDWLEGWLTPEKPGVTPQPSTPAPAAPAAPSPIPVSPPPSGKATPAVPAGPPVSAAPSDKGVPLAQPVPPLALPSAAPPPANKEAQTASQKAVHPLVEKVLQASGFDLETGRILNPEKFQKWKQQQAHTTPVTNASLLEVFRKARTAIEAWVDDPVNRSCIMQADLDEIKRQPAIQAILQEYANYGNAMQEKLLRHLERARGRESFL
jgi:GYF domain 2